MGQHLPPTTAQSTEELVYIAPAPAITSYSAAVPVYEVAPAVDNGRVPTTASRTVQAPAPAAAPVAYAAPAPQMMTITGVDMNRDGIPDVLQQSMAPAVHYAAPAPAVSYAAPAPAVQYAAPAPAVSCAAPATQHVAPAPAVYAAPAAATMTVTGVEMNRDGIPDVLQGGSRGAGVSYAAPATQLAAPATQYAAPVTQYAAPATMTVTGVDMNRDGIPDVLQRR